MTDLPQPFRSHPRYRDLLLLLALLVLVWWVRSLPFTLPSLDARGADLARLDALVHAQVPDRDASTIQAPSAHAMAASAADLRDRYTFAAADGTLHPYLMRWDSYAWVRTARNRIEQGSPCDERVAGECRDSLTVAPWGKAHIYAESLHLDAIVAVHRIASWIAPGYPISSSALWVQLILGVAGVVPAFFLGHRLGGPAGGLIAGVLVSLNPSLIGRSIGADNDIWNFALVLAQQWFLLLALLAARSSVAVATMLLAALCTWWWSQVWAGWIYGYLLACVTLIGYMLLAPLARAGRDKVLRAIVLAAVYYLAVGALLALTKPNLHYLDLLPDQLFGHLFPVAQAPEPAVQVPRLHWPDNLAGVAELKRPAGLVELTTSLGGPIIFLIAYLGLLLLCLPSASWRWGEMAVMALGVAAINLVLNADPHSARITQAALGAPLLAALALKLRVRDLPGAGAGLLLTVWCLSTLELGLGAGRFWMLFAAPWGIALGAAGGRILTWLRDELAGRGAMVRWTGNALLGMGLIGLLWQLARPGIGVAWTGVPKLTDTRVAALEHIGQYAEPNAIVTDLWENGYWDKYFARRAVHHDGGTLATHLPYWVGRVYAATDEREAIGVLRMLNCGSEASPLPEGTHGALHALETAGLEPDAAFRLLNALFLDDRDAAGRRLTAAGLEADARARVLERTHCDPPDSWIVTAPYYLDKPAAWLIPALNGPLIGPAEHASSEAVFARRQLNCSDADQGFLVCAYRATIDGEVVAAQIRVSRVGPARAEILAADGTPLGAPGLIADVNDGSVSYRRDTRARFAELGIWVDRAGARILIAPPRVLRSLLARLALVKGYRSEHLRPALRIDDPLGDHLRLWRVARWQ